MTRVDAQQVAQVRSFDRTVTAVIGALEDRFLGRDRPLGEARLLWEVGESGAEVRELRRRLGLDPGYTSRMLRLARARRTDRGRARCRGCARADRPPDRAGRRERQELDRRSDEFAEGLLVRLADDERDRSTTSMREVERLLTRARTRIEQMPGAHPDVRWCFGRYYAELDRAVRRRVRRALARRTDPADVTLPRGSGPGRVRRRRAGGLWRAPLPPRRRWSRSSASGWRRTCGVSASAVGC